MRKRVRLLACNRIKNRTNRCGWIVKVDEMCSLFVSAPSEEMFLFLLLQRGMPLVKKGGLNFTMGPRVMIKCSRHLSKPFESKASLSEKALWLCTLYFIYQGITPNDVQVVELHDCFSVNELLTYEGLGLCAEGKSVLACTCCRKNLCLT